VSDWEQGYVTDINYTFGYYGELNPLRVKLAFLNSGLAFPEVTTACELGFGQGLSTNIHAAASLAQWYGTDFNSSQVAFAQEMALASGAGAKLYDDAFADFADRSDLPGFDFIALHGIYSWISDENRRVIANFVQKKLKVGGVLYISYNTQPGWSSFAPIRHLMAGHARAFGTQSGGTLRRVDGAIAFVDRLFATNPHILKSNPQMKNRFDKVKQQSKHYLAHEYFNGNWVPFHFSDMAKWLEPAKVQFACSAHYLDHINALNLTAEQSAFLEGIEEPDFREDVRDHLVNQQFRRDYWVKGTRHLTPFEVAEQARRLRMILAVNRVDVSLKVQGVLGEASMNEDVYTPLLDALSDHKPKTLGEVEQELKGSGISFGQILQAVVVLAGQGSLQSAQSEAEISKARKQCEKLNGTIMLLARGRADINYLASPMTGGGIPANRFTQLFLSASAGGRRSSRELAEYVWRFVSSQGQKLVKEGRTLESVEENLAELTNQAERFLDKQLPVLKGLHVA
jgi:hypothetical protein